jgi:ABC-type multidrug transport system fused ATPase/permease subunit
VEEGPHEVLAASGGLYARLARQQSLGATAVAEVA